MLLRRKSNKKFDASVLEKFEILLIRVEFLVMWVHIFKID
jgi:hypothetical protein